MDISRFHEFDVCLKCLYSEQNILAEKGFGLKLIVRSDYDRST